MTRKSFAERLGQKAGLPESEAYMFLNIVINELRAEILSGGEFVMQEFGTLTVRKKKGKHMGIHNKFSEDHWIPYFRPSKEFLKELTNLPIKDVPVSALGFRIDGKRSFGHKNNPNLGLRMKERYGKLKAQDDPEKGQAD